MELRVNVQEPLRLDRAALPDFDVPVAAFGSQLDHARCDANDDNEAELLLILQTLDPLD